MILQAIRDRLVLEICEWDTVSAGGILLVHSEDASTRSMGVVVSIGESSEIPPSIHSGVKVIFERGLASFQEVSGKKYALISVYDVLAICKE